MDYSVISPKSFVLKVGIHCKRCEKDIHKALMKVRGVASVLIDAENEEVRVTGSLSDPYTLITALNKIGKPAEILSADANAPNNQHHYTHNRHVVGGIDGFDSHQLKQLSHIDGVKKVELTQSHNTKTTFKPGSYTKTETQSTKSVKITMNDSRPYGQSSVRQGGCGGRYCPDYCPDGPYSQCLSSSCSENPRIHYGNGGHGPVLEYCGHDDYYPAALPPPAVGWDSGRGYGGGGPAALPSQAAGWDSGRGYGGVLPPPRPPPLMNLYYNDQPNYSSYNSVRPYNMHPYDERENGCVVM